MLILLHLIETLVVTIVWTLVSIYAAGIIWSAFFA